ncbi:hypothetical protein ES703_48026 [subsurface metagenome]
MRTENYKHGVVSILLVFALVFSMVTISAPLASAGDWVNNPEPGGTTISVAQGDTFLIRHVLEWNEGITLGAYGVGGVPHTAAGAVGDNHLIITHTGGVIVIESGMKTWDRAAITIDVVGVGVTVDISPASQSGWTDDVLTYTVTVTNTGEVADNFDLSVTDDLGWTTSIVPDTLELAASASDTATLSVTVGSDNNNIQVTATGTYAENSDNCVARQLVGPNVSVEVSPDYQEDLPGTDLYYTVVTTNTGTVLDNITVSVEDTENWYCHFSTVQIYPTDDSHVCENIPDSVADSGGDYNMYVGWEASPYQTEGWKTRAYLRFDISSIPSGATINSATFNAKVDYGPSAGYPTYAIDNMLTDVKAVSGDAWLENELTWNNAPAVGATLDTTMVYDDTTVGRKVWYSWDVASFVTTEFAGDGVVSLCMLSENKEADNTDCTVWFYTKDANGDDP